MRIGPGSLAGLAELRSFRSSRLSSWDRSGGNADNLVIRPGEAATLGSPDGAGCVKHIWMTMMSIPGEEADLCSTVFRCFWDGEESPSVEVPLGDFFGIGFGERRNFASLPLQMSPQDGKGFNCWFPMPFADGARFAWRTEDGTFGEDTFQYVLAAAGRPPQLAGLAIEKAGLELDAGQDVFVQAARDGVLERTPVPSGSEQWLIDGGQREA